MLTTCFIYHVYPLRPAAVDSAKMENYQCAIVFKSDFKDKELTKTISVQEMKTHLYKICTFINPEEKLQPGKISGWYDIDFDTNKRESLGLPR